MLINGATSTKQVISVIRSKMSEPDNGRASIVVTAKGEEVRTQFKVIEAADLIVSNYADGRVNADYPAELQPRDRTRLASRNQVNSIANNLTPALLTDSGLSSHGSPIVGDDYVVESGNGRSMGIIKAYSAGKGAEYRQYLIDNAALFGLKKDVVQAMVAPVLVRQRTQEVDRLQFVKDSNISDLQSMSAAEQAAVDAERFNEAMIDLFTPSEDGDLFSKDNMPFVREYIRQIGETEAAGLLTSTGEPTRQLIDRLQNAVFSSAYGDKALVKMVAEEADPEIRNVLKALNVAAADFMMMRHMSKEAHQGVTDALNDGVEGYAGLGDEALQALTEAVGIVKDAKRSGQSVKEYVSQLGLFGDMSDEAKAFAVFIAANNRSAKKMGEAFKSLAQQVNRELMHGGMAVGDLFGDAPASLTEIMASVSIKMDEPDVAAKIAILDKIPVDTDGSPETQGFKAFKELDNAYSMGAVVSVELKLGYVFDGPMTFDQSTNGGAVNATVRNVEEYKALKVSLVSDISEKIDFILDFYQSKIGG